MARKVAGDLVLYLYAVTKSGIGDTPQVRGVDGEARIEAIPCAGLTCWISRVPAAEFGESFSQRLENLDWLAAVSVRHQRVIAAIAESRDTLPARLGTVFLSETSLEADIRKRKAALEADLRRIAGTPRRRRDRAHLRCIASTGGIAGEGADRKGISPSEIEPAALAQAARIRRRRKEICPRTGATRDCNRRRRQDKRWNARPSISGKRFVEAQRSSQVGKVVAPIFPRVEGYT